MSITEEIRTPKPMSSYANVERLRDLEDCVQLIRDLSQDSTSLARIEEDPPANVDPYFSEFGNY